MVILTHMDTNQQELQKAIDFVRNTFAEKKETLDYKPDSVKYLDKLFDNEFKNGKLKNPSGGFAKYQGVIMIGISGYLAEVILRNTVNTKLTIDNNDANWFINFKLAGENTQAIQPGQMVLKRIQEGKAASLYGFAVSAIKYFNQSPGTNQDAAVNPPEKKKPWWKLG